MSAQAQSQTQGFVDPFVNPYDDLSKSGGLYNSDSIGYRLGDLIGYSNTKNWNEMTLAKLNAAYERASVASARAWDEYMDSTHYQRTVKDLKAAGLNPWLALQSGIGNSGSTQTASQGGSAKAKIQSKESSNGIAMLLIAAAKLVSTLMS